MYLASVLSHLDAWELIRTSFSNEFQDIMSAISQAKPQKRLVDAPKRESNPFIYRCLELKNSIVEQFIYLNWISNCQDINELYISRERRSNVDLIKNGIGIEITFSKFSYAESATFVKFPLFIKAERFQIGLIILASKSMHESLPVGSSSFEMVRDRFVGLGPLNLKFPFALLGITDIPVETKVEELTSNLDLFLIKKIGMSLLEMKWVKERPQFDFKQELPENDKLAKEVCAMANNEKGGLILVGIADNGDMVGLPRDLLDDTQLRITNIIRANCTPIPKFEIKSFDADDIAGSCILIVDIYEMERKPCMFRDKVYIRAGASAEPAKPDDIRRLLLGGVG